jgi:hypothetical protein
MTMDGTIRALTDLSEIDRRLGESAALAGAALAALERRRDALRKSIPASPLQSYDALGRTGRRPFLVELRSTHCGGCYLRLPPQIHSRIRRRESLGACPHCSRLLYWPASEDVNGEPARSMPAAPPAPKPKTKTAPRRSGPPALHAGTERRRKGPAARRPEAGSAPRARRSPAAPKRRRLYQS